MAAEVYQLNILKERIEDHASNTTRFLIMGTGTNAGTASDKTSIIFGTSDAPGALHRALRPFAERGVNLMKIASYPARDSGRGRSSSWEYLFFADADGHENDERVRDCLKDLKALTSFMKILGSYPQGRDVL
jgi:chorismate mutase/prephenate dehydratase